MWKQFAFLCTHISLVRARFFFLLLLFNINLPVFQQHFNDMLCSHCLPLLLALHELINLVRLDMSMLLFWLEMFKSKNNFIDGASWLSGDRSFVWAYWPYRNGILLSFCVCSICKSQISDWRLADCSWRKSKVWNFICNFLAQPKQRKIFHFSHIKNNNVNPRINNIH